MLVFYLWFGGHSRGSAAPLPTCAHCEPQHYKDGSLLGCTTAVRFGRLLDHRKVFPTTGTKNANAIGLNLQFPHVPRWALLYEEIK